MKWCIIIIILDLKYANSFKFKKQGLRCSLCTKPQFLNRNFKSFKVTSHVTCMSLLIVPPSYCIAIEVCPHQILLLCWFLNSCLRCCQLLYLQVLRLFHFLVKFGYYGSEDIKKLLKPLLIILDCRHDKPFPPETDKGGQFILLFIIAVQDGDVTKFIFKIILVKIQLIPVFKGKGKPLERKSYFLQNTTLRLSKQASLALYQVQEQQNGWHKQAALADSISISR